MKSRANCTPSLLPLSFDKYILRSYSLDDYAVRPWDSTSKNGNTEMSNPAPFKQYFASVNNMNTKQRKFYEGWLRAWQRGKKVDVAGQISYLFCYVYSVLGRGAKKALPELIKVRDAYSGEEDFVPYCSQWISDCFVLFGKYHEAIKAYPILSPDSRSSLATSHLLSLKVLVGQHAAGREILTLLGSKVTEFGKKHLNEVMKYADILLRSYEQENGINILREWLNDSPQFHYSVFRGTYSSTSVNIMAYDFSGNKRVMDFVSHLTREAENTVREEGGLPKVGEGWIAETQLYHEIKSALPDMQVLHHARPEWLRNLHLDIYIPELYTAIEYQGIQHQLAVEHFGGEQAFIRRKCLDALKKRRCQRNGVRLIYVYPGYMLSDIIKNLTVD